MAVESPFSRITGGADAMAVESQARQPAVVSGAQRTAHSPATRFTAGATAPALTKRSVDSKRKR